MKDRSAGFQKVRFLIIILLCILLACEIVTCLEMVRAGRYDIKYEVQYDVSPLKLKRVEITNREDLRDLYQIPDTRKLYEVCFTYGNIADFTSSHLSVPEFEASVSEDKIYPVYSENHYKVYSELAFNQAVPVGKTGSIIFYIALEENEPCVTITEKDDKLTGKGESMEIRLPDRQGETSQWEAED